MGLKERLQALASKHATQATQAVRDENATQFQDGDNRLRPEPCVSSPLMSSFTFGVGGGDRSPVGKRPKTEPTETVLFDSSFSFGPDDAEMDGIVADDDMDSFLKATVPEDSVNAPLKEKETRLLSSAIESTFEPMVRAPNMVKQRSRLRDVFMEEDNASVPLGAVPIISLTQSSTSFLATRGTLPDAKAKGMLRALPVVMIPETFQVSQLQENMRTIALQVSNLILTAVPEPYGTAVYKITEIIGLLVRDFRLIGGIAQLKCVDFEGGEHQASLSLDILTTLKFKLHFGLTLILTNISVFSPAPRLRYLNITLSNVLAVYENVREIN